MRVSSWVRAACGVAVIVGTGAIAAGCGDGLQESCVSFCSMATSCYDTCPSDLPRCAALIFGKDSTNECVRECQGAYNDFGGPCRQALIDYNVCYGELSCQEFGTDVSACAPQSEAVVSECEVEPVGS